MQNLLLVMRAFFLLLAVVAVVSRGVAQTDSVKVFGRKELVRGVYKNYQEFTNNAPSLNVSFILTPFAWTLLDSSAVGVQCTWVKESKINEAGVWGFCDGQSVFVKYNNDLPPLTVHIGKSLFWKLDCIGPFSYFTFIEPNRWALLPFGKRKPEKVKPYYQWMYLLDSKGKIKDPKIGLMKKYLSSQPDLLKSFSEKADIYEPYDYNNTPEPESDEMRFEKYALIKTYLLKLNKALTVAEHK